MVWGLPARAGFQPALPTASRARTKPIRRVSSLRKCVWQSMTNCFVSASARAFACSGAWASAALTSNSAPYTSFIARNAAAMPEAARKNWRRLRPCRRASASPSAVVRASTCRWRGV